MSDQATQNNVPSRVNPNDKIQVGFIGVGRRGTQVMGGFLEQPDVEVAAVCDVFEPAIEKMKAKFGDKVKGYRDFRKMLEQKDLDAVVVATPDHWHAIQTIDACDAGKDVYVEKPISQTIHEGRRMVDAAWRNNRVVTVGLHRRSTKIYSDMVKFVQGGNIGKVTVCRCYHRSNMYPSGIGKCEPIVPPAGLDWDMWLGPRPDRPFQENIAPYKFRWWSQYSSQIANNGVHFLDLIRWANNEKAPSSVCGIGGKYVIDDDRQIPDTAEITFEFPSGHLVVLGTYEANGNRTLARGGHFEVRGTLGSIFCGDKLCEVVPEIGGQFQDAKPKMKAQKIVGEGKNRQATANHARNFLDCIRSRQRPNCDIEEGHRSTTMSLLANISLELRSRLNWDAENERVTNNEEANNYLHYEYRKPWKLC